MRPWIALLALPLAACQTTDAGTPAAPAAALPADYRQQILERARAEFFDPYSIRDAGISQPITGQALSGQVVSVCVRANAKNRMGAYTGQKVTAFTFQNGQISTTDHQYAALTCASAQFEPFPEIEAGYQPPPPAKRKG